MKKPSSKTPKGKVSEAERFDPRKVDLTKFKPDITRGAWLEMIKPSLLDISLNSIFFDEIETLRPTKTIGKGRTNLTLIMATIVQVDATTPHASFDMQATPSRKPVVQMHFEPAAYGFTTVGTYVMTFFVEVVGTATFNLSGSFPFASGGTRTLSGKTSVSLVFKNVPPTQQLFGFLEQKSGGSWTWFSTRVSPPPLLITL